jgi:hypothetical protein
MVARSTRRGVDPASVPRPCAHVSHCSGGLARKSPFAVVGRAAYRAACAVPPTTSQRYQRSPFFQPLSDGRNQAQLSWTRIARLSSTPMNLSNARSHRGKSHFPCPGER